MTIPFNKPYITGKELSHVSQCVLSGHIAGNGHYTKKCQTFFNNRYSFNKTLLTTSCTDALEMCAMLLDIKPGDEVIIPSYTFVSTALAFIREGATIVFADSRNDRPGIDENKIEDLITDRTKAIVPVHYAGIACDMDKIMNIANRHNIYVVEDAAQAIDGVYKGKPLGGIGHLGVMSFHETKNIQCGEGGLLIINDDKFKDRAEVLWEKGTNRAEFFRGEVNKYGWVDKGSSFLPSELSAAFLYAQLEELDNIQNVRKSIWNEYYRALKPFESNDLIDLPIVPDFSSNNAHMFYIVFKNINFRTKFISLLKERNICSVFHYLSLHKSDFYTPKHDGRSLLQSDKYTDRLVRLPMYYDLYEKDLKSVIENITSVLNNISKSIK